MEAFRTIGRVWLRSGVSSSIELISESLSHNPEAGFFPNDNDDGGEKRTFAGRDSVLAGVVLKDGLEGAEGEGLSDESGAVVLDVEVGFGFLLTLRGLSVGLNMKEGVVRSA
jgi:hypothetical protein